MICLLLVLNTHVVYILIHTAFILTLYNIYAWAAFPFILSIHHKITLVVSGKRQQLIKTVTSLMAEEATLNGLRWIV